MLNLKGEIIISSQVQDLLQLCNTSREKCNLPCINLKLKLPSPKFLPQCFIKSWLSGCVVFCMILLFIYFLGAAVFDLAIEGNHFETKHDSTLWKICSRFRINILNLITRGCTVVDRYVNIKRTGSLPHASHQYIVFISFIFNQMINSLYRRLLQSKNRKECISIYIGKIIQ